MQSVTHVTHYESRSPVSRMSHRLCVTNWVSVSEIELGESCHTYESRTHITYMSLRVWGTNCICVTNWVSVSEIEPGGMSESCHELSHEVTSHTRDDTLWLTQYELRTKICDKLRVTSCMIVQEFEQGGKSESCHKFDSQSHVTYMSRRTLCHELYMCMGIWAGQYEWVVSHIWVTSHIWVSSFVPHADDVYENLSRAVWVSRVTHESRSQTNDPRTTSH